mmetsp:Transcript_62178/g.157027  ORF Transcript_62178/g.157027 Transcript_62178/m.157027 type:complete len:251 (-) Transcript_62178:906-1658(-)
MCRPGPGNPVTKAGKNNIDFGQLKEPRPKQPSSLLPHANTDPDTVSARECLQPAAMALRGIPRIRLLTAVGDEACCTFSPNPSWPQLLLPNAKSSPPSVRTSECASPQATVATRSLSFSPRRGHEGACGITGTALTSSAPTPAWPSALEAAHAKRTPSRVTARICSWPAAIAVRLTSLSSGKSRHVGWCKDPPADASDKVRPVLRPPPHKVPCLVTKMLRLLPQHNETEGQSSATCLGVGTLCHASPVRH